MNTAEPSRRIPRAKDAASILRQYLEDYGFQNQDRLPPERELVNILDVSRSRLRAGLEQLASEGLIWRHVGKGTYFGSRPIEQPNVPTQISAVTNPREVMEARLAIEPYLIRLATFRASQLDFIQIQEFLDKSAEAQNVEDFIKWDSSLHRAIAVAAKNNLMLAQYDWIHSNRHTEVWGRVSELFLTPERMELYSDQHRKFVAAMRDRDAASAERYMRDHLDCVREHIFGGI